MKLLLMLSLIGTSVAFGKPYKITDEDAAFEEAKKKNKGVAYVFG